MATSGFNPKIINNKYILFVGAGASAPLGLKPTAPFLELLMDKLPVLVAQGVRPDFKEEEYRDSFNNLFQLAAQHFNVTLPDSEIVLDYLDHISDVCNQLHSLPSLFRELAGTGAVTGLHDRWGKMFMKVRGCIQKVVVEHYSKVDGEAAFGIYNPLLQELCEQGQTLPIFTTNYDWVFENLAEVSNDRLRLEDGFKEYALGPRWERSVFKTFDSRPDRINLVLFKLHGSTSWYRDADTPHHVRKFPNPSPELAGSRAVLIYPTQVKDQATQDEPFRTGYEYLRETLMNTNLGVIIGFSFRDPAINDIFHLALAKNKKLKLAIVEPRTNEENGIPFDEVLQRLGIEKQEQPVKIRVIKGRFGIDQFVYREIAKTVQQLDQWDSLTDWVSE